MVALPKTTAGWETSGSWKSYNIYIIFESCVLWATADIPELSLEITSYYTRLQSPFPARHPRRSRAIFTKQDFEGAEQVGSRITCDKI